MAAPIVSPQDERELAETLRSARAANEPLKLIGAGSKTLLGRHAPAVRAVSLARLNGVTMYEPEELVIRAGAGTPLDTITAMLDAHGQELAFEPVNYGQLFGSSAAPTIGGVVAVNASGPRRVKAGAARDHLLGFRCVTGRGELVKSGGRVMKNVTGFDLSKLVCGSYGTLAALTEITFKVAPKAEREETVLFSGLTDEASLSLLRAASGAQCEGSAFAMLPAGAPPLNQAGAVALVRLEGSQVGIAERRDDLVKALTAFGAKTESLANEESRALWLALRDMAPVARSEGQVWRVSTAPSAAFSLLDAIRRSGAPLVAHYFDWVGGLILMALEPAPDAHAPIIRAEVERLGGHATLLRASDAVRASVPVFQPQPVALAALARRIKDSFDPAHILERGRMSPDY